MTNGKTYPDETLGPRLLPLPLAAEHLSIGLRTLKARIAAGSIPVVRVSPGRVAIDPRDLDAYITAQRTKA